MNKPVLQDQDICIIIADDSKMNMLLLSTILGHLLPSARVKEATAAGDIRSLLPEERPSLIFLDHSMQGLKPEDIAAGCHEAGYGPVPLIGMRSVTEGMEMLPGIDDMITKPADEHGVMLILHKWLSQQSSATGEEPHFEEGYIFNHVGADTNIIRDVWGIVMRQLHQDQARLVELGLQGPSAAGELKKLGHKLYGGARTVGFSRLAALSRELEMHDDPEHTHILVAEIKAEIEAVFPIIQQQLEKL